MESVLDTQISTEQVLVDRVLEQYQGLAGNLLPILHAVQDAIAYISDEAVAQIALGLNLSRAEVHGVVSFYHHFRTAPPPRHTVQICQAEGCQARGARALTAHAEQAFGCAMPGHRHDASLGLEPVYCLGLCANGPAVQVDDRHYAAVDAEKLNRIVGKVLEGDE